LTGPKHQGVRNVFNVVVNVAFNVAQGSRGDCEDQIGDVTVKVVRGDHW
jgi:hypothetical protein